MPDEIINRVAKSNLVTIDLEDLYPSGTRVQIDLKNWLYQGLVLREKEFRTTLKNHDWSIYKECYVALMCSSDAIIPGWAFMLVSAFLQPFAKKIVVGDLEHLESVIFQEIISDLELSQYKNKPIIIKGCAHKPIPSNAYIWLTNKLIPYAKSIMYGEACSSVPLYKKR